MEELINQLRRKEGSWVEWGRSCQQLQKLGMNPQAIFEQTGFEPIQQNQIIVAAQVYGALEGIASEDVLAFFGQKGSDILYELRVLPQADRKEAAELVQRLQLDALEAHELAKAVKELDLLAELPKGFTRHAGDAMAYQAWKSCQNLPDVAQRTKYISRGLRYAHSASARQQIEKLLTELVTTPVAKPPRLPVYRLEEGEDLPRIMAVAGHLPMTAADFAAVPIVESIEPFGLIQYTGLSAWVALPGWQVVREMEDGIVLFADTATLQQFSQQHIPSSFPDRPEAILLLIDRARRTYDREGYFLIEESGYLHLRCFAEPPTVKILGRLMLVLRQRRVLDDAVGEDPWILEE